jgi:hypothetical protein
MRTRQSPLNAACREQLLNGGDVLSGRPYGNPRAGGAIFTRDGAIFGQAAPTGAVPFDEALAREHWKEYHVDLLAECGPDCRPWAWWAFEAPEPRRIVDWGAPACLYATPPGQRLVLGAVYESEQEYLARLGLVDRREAS